MDSEWRIKWKKKSQEISWGPGTICQEFEAELELSLRLANEKNNGSFLSMKTRLWLVLYISYRMFYIVSGNLVSYSWALQCYLDLFVVLIFESNVHLHSDSYRSLHVIFVFYCEFRVIAQLSKYRCHLFIKSSADNHLRVVYYRRIY